MSDSKPICTTVPDPDAGMLAVSRAIPLVYVR